MRTSSNVVEKSVLLRLNTKLFMLFHIRHINQKGSLVTWLAIVSLWIWKRNQRLFSRGVPWSQSWEVGILATLHIILTWEHENKVWSFVSSSVQHQEQYKSTFMLRRLRFSAIPIDRDAKHQRNCFNFGVMSKFHNAFAISGELAKGGVGDVSSIARLSAV